MLDAGSSGSRIHVYRFNYCSGPSPTLEKEVFEQLKPGLSSVDFTTPRQAADSLNPLLTVALETVPKELWKCTPIALKATAGLRMKRPEGSGQKIIDAVKSKLENDYPFNLVEDGVSIMLGKDEGVFAWITVNYLLKRIGQADRFPTAAIMDLGGGSTQLVFEPKSKTKLEPGDHLVHLSFGKHKYDLYQHSYDGYGLNAARKRVQKASVLNKAHPCYAVGHTDKYLDETGTSPPQSWSGAWEDFSTCHNFISTQLFVKNGVCHVAPCSFGGTYQPSLADTFADNDIYAFSYFYDKYAEPFGALTEKGFTVGQIRTAAENVCSGKMKAADLPVDSATKEILAQFEDPDWCTDLGFIYGLLSVGYDIADDRVLKTAKKIAGYETGWSLGATIHLLDSMMAGGMEGVCKK